MYWENLIKNVIILILLVPTYSSIQNFVLSSNIDQTSAGSLLVAVSILAVTACFGNFAFTYEKVNQKDTSSRMLGHATTGLLTLLIGISLEMTAVLAAVLIGDFIVFNISLVILFFASILYDFWDLKRAEVNSKP